MRTLFSIVPSAVGVAVLLLAAPAEAAEAVGVITGDDVNLRAGPGARYEVVVQVDRGERLSVVAEDGDWIEVRPPQETDLWIYAALVKEGVVVASRVQVRCGPGINYTAVGQVDRDATLTVRGRFKDWLKVKPPPDTSLWVSADYVRIPQARETAAGALPARGRAPDAKPAPARPVEPQPQPEPAGAAVAPKPDHAAAPERRVPAVPPRPSVPPHRREIERMDVTDVEDAAPAPGAEHGEQVRYEGELRPAGFVIGRPSPFRLVRRTATGRGETVCYVRGSEAKLRSVLGRRIVLQGRESEQPGARWPVVDAVRIQVQP